MTIVGTGKWTPSSVGTSVQDRDYFSGVVTINNTAYADAQTYEFGFSASEVHIVNPSGGVQLVFQWLSRRNQVVDSGVIPTGSSLVLRTANKTGVRLRVESGSAAGVYVMAVG
jgi:hypothetical protein